jgi:hypothetical protein
VSANYQDTTDQITGISNIDTSSADGPIRSFGQIRKKGRTLILKLDSADNSDINVGSASDFSQATDSATGDEEVSFNYMGETYYIHVWQGDLVSPIPSNIDNFSDLLQNGCGTIEIYQR